VEPNPRFPPSADPRDASRSFGTAKLQTVPTEISLRARCLLNGRVEEIARKAVDWPLVEADVTARSDTPTNPVDLGTILVPYDWLLLGPGTRAVVKTAVLSNRRDIPNARLRIWFDSDKGLDIAMPIVAHRRIEKEVTLPNWSTRKARAILNVRLSDGSAEL